MSKNVKIPNKKLTEYEKGEQVALIVTNHRTGTNEWRIGEVLDKGTVYQQNGRDYPKLHVKTLFTYYKNDTKEFYERENTFLVFYDDEIAPLPSNIKDSDIVIGNVVNF